MCTIFIIMIVIYIYIYIYKYVKFNIKVYRFSIINKLQYINYYEECLYRYYH